MFGPALHHLNVSPPLRSLTWESFLFRVGNASLYRFWKVLPKDEVILPGTLLQASPVLNHLPVLQASIYPAGKKKKENNSCV